MKRDTRWRRTEATSWQAAPRLPACERGHLRSYSLSQPQVSVAAWENSANMWAEISHFHWPTELWAINGYILRHWILGRFVMQQQITDKSRLPSPPYPYYSTTLRSHVSRTQAGRLPWSQNGGGGAACFLPLPVFPMPALSHFYFALLKIKF